MAFKGFSKIYLNILMVLLFCHLLFHYFLFDLLRFSLYLNEALSGSSGTLIIGPLSPINVSSLKYCHILPDIFE